MRACVALALALVLAATTARADGTADEAIALALFTDGRELAAHGDYIHACAKFESAHRLEPWLGIELNLADCYAHLGRTASAWVLYRKAGDEAARRGDPRAAFARDRAAQLEPTLAHVTVTGAGGARIALDHEVLPAAGAGTPLPIDPGDHVVDATAPGRVAWSRHLTIAAGQAVAIDVPVLAAAMVAPPAVRVHRPRWLLPLGAGGLAAITGSLALGLDAKLRYDDAHGCDAALVCDDRGYAAIRAARARGDAATVVGGLGVLALGAAAILYFDAPVAPIVAPSTLGLSVQGRL